jgi:chromosome partitioning protein
MAKVVAVTGRKGGIGKSTITGNLAGELTALGYSVRVLDTDPQQSLLGWANLGDGLLKRITTAVETDHPEKFKQAVEAAKKVADIVLIDTPPAFADPALLAALLSDVVLLPAGPSPLDIMAARDALELVREAQAQRGGAKPVIRFVPSKTIPRAGLSNDLPQTLAGLGEPVLPGLAQRTVVAEAALSGLTVLEYAKNSPARAEFETLTKALRELL